MSSSEQILNIHSSHESAKYEYGKEISKADLAAFSEYRTKLISRAQDALHTEAESYRGFHVACAMLVVDKNGTYRIFASGNSKQYQGQPKLCAEREALQQARDEALKNNDLEQRVVGIVVVSPNIDTDPIKNADESKHRHTTLYPCLSCCSMLKTEPMIQPNTILLTLNTREIPEEADHLHEYNSVGDVVHTVEEEEKKK